MTTDERAALVREAVVRAMRETSFVAMCNVAIALGIEQEIGPSTIADTLLSRFAENERLAVDAKRMREGLERIAGMCDVPDACACGRPRGVAAVRLCASRAAIDAAMTGGTNDTV